MKFRALVAVFLVFVLSCSFLTSALALSDNEYAQMMRNAGFKKADMALSQTWKEAQKKLVKNKTALANLRKDQREWVARGRDSEAEDLMDIEGYDRLKAYTVATNLRAEYLPELAQQYLEEAGGTVKKSENKKTENKKAENKKAAPERPAAQPKNNNKNKNNKNLEYPTLGLCTGNNVRLRDNPGTGSNSKVVGRADDTDQLILLGEKNINGETWYAVDNPNDSGTVWIHGNYVDTYKGDAYGTPAFKMSLEVRMNFGLKPEKARAMLGEPNKVTHDTFFFDPAGRELKEDTYEFSGCILRYVEGRLRHVEVFEAGLNFGALSVGESREKIIEILGKSRDDEGSDSLNYEVSPIEAFLFELEDDAITRMTWDEYMDS